MVEAQESAQHGIMQRINYDNLKKRMGTLRGELHCIKVGGDSFKEKENRVEIFRDAVLAVKACCNNGITLGGNVSINACIKRNKADIVKEIVDIIESNPRENIGINICKKDILKAVEDILDVVSKSSQALTKVNGNFLLHSRMQQRTNTWLTQYLRVLMKTQRKEFY